MQGFAKEYASTGLRILMEELNAVTWAPLNPSGARLFNDRDEAIRDVTTEQISEANREDYLGGAAFWPND